VPEELSELRRSATGIAGYASSRALVITSPVHGAQAARSFGSQLAQLTYGFARAGVDLIKDDHSLADQTSAPFAERVERCQEAVVRANDETGGNALYFPNVTSDPSEMMARAGAARRAGCRGVLVNALPAGLGAVGEIAATTGLAIMSHPRSRRVFPAGSRLRARSAVGELFRVAGAMP